MDTNSSKLPSTEDYQSADGHASESLTDEEVKRLGDLQDEFARRKRGGESEDNIQKEIEARLKEEGNPWADVWAHAAAWGHIRHDAKYRVMLDWFNGWVDRLTAENEKQFGQFSDLQLLGSGGFGAVFRACDKKRPHPGLVAIKLPHVPAGKMPDDRETISASAQQHANFFEEARKHANITVAGCVAIYEFGMPDTFDIDQILVHLRTTPIWFSMQFIDGKSLYDVLHKTPHGYKRGETIPDDQVIELITKIAERLQSLHATPSPNGKGAIIHKDLKPANILLDHQNTPWLTDFGLASARFNQKVTGNPFSGTRAYAAPEQFAGIEANEQTDIWAWGVIFYELLTGQLPFDGETRIRDEQSPVPKLRALRPDLPEYLESVIDKCLRRNRQGPEARYGSFAEVLDDMRAEITSDELFSLAQKVSTELLSEAFPESHRHVAIEEVEEQLQQFFGSTKTTLIVDGLPGSGKTTLLKRVARVRDGFYIRLNDLTAGEDWWKRGDFAIARSDSAFDGDFPKFIKLLAGRRDAVVVCLDGLERTRDAALFASHISEDRPSFPPNVKFVLGIRRSAVSAEVDRQLAGLNVQVIELPVLRDGVLDHFLSAFDVPTALPMAMRRSLTTPFLVNVVAQADATESVENASHAIRTAFDDAVGANSAKQVFLHAFSRVLVNRDSYSPIPASDVISAAENRLSASDCDVESNGSLCRQFYERGLIIDDGKGLATTHDRFAEYLVAAELIRELEHRGTAAIADRLLEATPDGLLWASTDLLMDMVADEKTWEQLVLALLTPLDNYVSHQTDERINCDSSQFTGYLWNSLAEASGEVANKYPQFNWQEAATSEVRQATALIGSMYVKSPTRMTDVIVKINKQKYSWWVWVQSLSRITQDPYFFTLLDDFDQLGIETVTHAFFTLAKKSLSIRVSISGAGSGNTDIRKLTEFPGPQLPLFFERLGAHRTPMTHLERPIVAEVILEAMPRLIDKAARCKQQMIEHPSARGKRDLCGLADDVPPSVVEALEDSDTGFAPFTYLDWLFDYVCRVANCIERPTAIENVFCRIEPRSLLRLPGVFAVSYPYVTLPFLLAEGRKSFVRIRESDNNALKLIQRYNERVIAYAIKFANLQLSKDGKNVREVLWTIEWICEVMLASAEISFFLLRFKPFVESIRQLDSIVLRITAYEMCADSLGHAAGTWEKQEQNEHVQELILHLRTECGEACELLEAELASLGLYDCPDDDTVLPLLPEAELSESDQAVLREVCQILGVKRRGGGEESAN